ncbi:NAD(P)-dependent alcohol dehydrogenase [Chitinophaga sp.]|uniref:zinc-dependent alcohol dehydrogenase family protein n=1 Tax=Chitinophaga sp. TaxID=1869181 RepID=UPI0031D0CD3D
MVPDTMRSWRMDGIGKDLLRLEKVAVPNPGKNEILIKVKAVSLNYRDKMVIESGRGLPLVFPFTPCSDLSGEVVAIGVGVSRFIPGDRVISTFTPDWVDGIRPGNARTPFYRTLGGFYPGVLSEYVVLSEEWLVRAPASLTYMQASTLPCAGLTAWFALVERANVGADDIVLIPGTGGVALFGLQIAKVRGARVIVSGRQENRERVIAAGADYFIDKANDNLLESVYTITDNYGADVVLEVIGGGHLSKAVQSAAVGGRICQIGALDGFELSTPAMPLMLKDVTIHGIGTGSRKALENLVSAVDDSELKPIIDSQYTMEEFLTALEHLDRGPFGKIVILCQ